jgi:hypothetical protein
MVLPDGPIATGSDNDVKPPVALRMHAVSASNKLKSRLRQMFEANVAAEARLESC